MKKLTLFLVAMLFSALSFAALNPYAYGLSSTLDGTTLTVNYSLNAPATAVSVVIMDGETEVKTIACDGITKGSHSVEIPTLGLSTGKSLTWKVVVKGTSVNKPTKESTQYSFWGPRGLAIDKDPESEHFGRILVTESYHPVKDMSNYQSSGKGAGIYVFKPDFTTEGNVENGGLDFTNVLAAKTGFMPWRVKISEDGRIFVSSLDKNGVVVWEVSKDLKTWTPVISGTNNNTDYNIYDADGDFFAGLNVAMDVQGSGENLKLLLYSANKTGIAISQAGYRLDEYALGTATTFTGKPKNIIIGGDFGYVHTDVDFIYDGEGGYWFGGSRGGSDGTPSLVHINSEGVEDLRDETATYYGGGGVLIHKGLLFKGKARSSSSNGKFGIYTIGKKDGKTTLTQKWEVISTGLGRNHNQFAVDFAENLYVIGNSQEKIQAYTLPYSGTVETPCASKYAFEVEEIVANVYTLTTNVVGEGTIEGNDGSYVEGTTATLTATPAEHYDFLNWTYGSETSTDNPLTITVNSDMTVTANFQEHAKYTINAHADDNSKGYVTGGAADIYVGTNISLKATAKTGYYFTQWNDGNTDNPRAITVTGDAEYIAEFAQAYPRVYAYDLDVADNGDSYTFSFKPNTNAVSGNLLLYNEDGTAVVQTHAITTAIVAHTATSITLNKTELPNQADVPWAIQLSGNPIPAFAETFADADYRFAKGHAAIDNSPESEYFGRVYVADRRSTKANSGLYVYNTDLTQLNAEAYKLGMSTAGYSRPAVGADGTVYLTGYTDDESGIFVVDPADLTKCTQFYDGTRAGSGLFTNGGAELGSSTSGVGVYGEGKNAVLYSMMEDGTDANANSGKQPIVKYQIGQEDGTVLKQWSTAPTWHINYPAKSADKSYNYGNNAFAATEKGVWISQHKANDDDRPEIAFIDKNGTIQFMQNLNKSQGAGLAVNADNTILYLQKAGEILEYTIAWTGNTPALTLANTYPVSLQHITTLSLDYAGNLIACAGTQYGSNTNNNVMKLVAYTLPTNDNTCIVPAAKTKVLKLGVRYNVEVLVNDNTMGRATGGGDYKEGETATLTATPAANHQFVNWTYGSETSTDNPLELVVDGDITVTANFAPVQYTLIAPTNDEDKGTVTGAGTYNYGTEVTLTASPAAGYKLLYWSDRSTENPRTITMTKNEAISAYFVKEYSEEPIFTIEKVWENTNVPASTGNGYQAVGWDGKIYMQDAGNKKIVTYSSEEDRGTDYVTGGGAGQQIAVDEAGNLIVFNAYFATATPGAILIYQKGSTTGKAVSFTLPDPAACHFFSASGDIYSASGGYVYFYCNGKTAVNRLKITNGAATAADVTTDIVGGSTYAGGTQNHVMVDIFGNLVAHARSNAASWINVYTNESSKTFATTLSGIKLSTLGGCSFELGGKELWAYNVGSTAYNSEWNIYNLTDKKNVSQTALYAKNTTDKNSAANWLNVQVVDENTAYIYQFCPKVAAAVWRVKMISGNLHTVTVVADNGTVDGNAGTYEDGATATLTAKPNTGYKFVSWTKEGTIVSTDATYTFTVTEDVTLVANFEALPQYTITVTSNDAAMGTVTGGGTYYEGTEVTLTASAVGGYVFSNWSDGNTDNPRTIQVTADATYTANFKVAIARVFAYNLDMIDNGDSYTFSFIPNANAISGRLIVYNDSKAQVLAQPITSSIVKGVKNEMTISKTSLPAKGTWAIELTGEQVDKLTLLTKADDKANYGFNRPQGVAIDNNPASDFFGRIYIALPKAGGTGYSDTNYGIVVMDPQHKRLKSGVVANGDALGANGRYSMHRVAVNPTNGHVYYVRTSDSSEGVTGTAIYELTPDATNILTDGGTAKNVISGASDITNANSVCFDETGAMYVMANANYDSGASLGRVYKVVDGVATLFTPNSIELASRDNAIVPDGKGGFWAAQHRDNFDTFSHLLHITATGTVDYSIDKNSADASLLPVQPYTSGGKDYTNASYRGQVAYYSIDENNGLVAYGGGAKVSVFKVSYDGAGKPSLTAWQTISLLTQSTTAGVNVDGIAFDYAGNLIVMSATDERMYQYALPTNNNTSIVPAKSSLSIGEVNKITYELNGGVWNKYGWTSKEDMYNAFVTEWKAYSGSTQYFCSYETQLGIGNSNKGLPTAILSAQPILDFMAQAKWAWLGQFLDALATAQGKATMPTANGIQMRWGLGNFFGEDNNGSTTWHGAVDCSAGQANPEAFQPIWGQSLPHPIQPTTTVVLGNPYKEGYLFDGWYATSDFSGAKVTIVDETTNGTLYAKWLEHRYTRPVTNGNFGTICLPYGSSSYNGAEFYEIAYLELQADGVTPKGIWLDEVIGALEAGKPYIFKATSTQLIVNYEGDAELNPVAGKAGLTGIFEAIPTTNDILEGNYMIAQNKFWLCGTGCWLDANRAYIEHDALHANTTPVSPMPGRRRVMMGAAGTNQATGIDHLTENGTITPTMEGTYDVLGRKMTEPTATGFYIIDGKKVVIVK